MKDHDAYPNALHASTFQTDRTADLRRFSMPHKHGCAFAVAISLTAIDHAESTARDSRAALHRQPAHRFYATDRERNGNRLPGGIDGHAQWQRQHCDRWVADGDGNIRAKRHGNRLAT